ncbi:hypothetical protein HS088_TW15G00732 [Tripterygium wilfordii]|uniref:Peptidase A1 domain-containing protein n=2 Tax=Tripterygium wilfordii TaxID=458696 RepID=A0A7J7CMC8_TRIWF|nr:hypothetical protein HS088_TW15G00732 [Tripterygium wilfordii]
MNISMGSPPIQILGIADTGSDLTWTQCKPCDECYYQKPPMFDPIKSSSYNNLTCDSKFCHALSSNERACLQDQNICEYTYTYGDQSVTEGFLATEKFSLSPGHSHTLVFGCGHDNEGTFDEAGSGIIGIGGGVLSLISQLGSSINGQFAYCLVPTVTETSSSNITSKITFGSDSVISGSCVVTTPLVEKDPATYYYVTLEAITVGNKRLDYYNNSSKNDCVHSNIHPGNMIVDSGTTLTFLNSGIFNRVLSILEEAIDAEPVKDPEGLFKFCFRDKKGVDLPVVIAHFTGADLKLQPLNTFAQVQDGLVCFTMMPSEDLAIFGNLSQMNFVVAYDLEKKSVSFLPTDCTKY